MLTHPRISFGVVNWKTSFWSRLTDVLILRPLLWSPESVEWWRPDIVFRLSSWFSGRVLYRKYLFCTPLVFRCVLRVVFGILYSICTLLRGCRPVYLYISCLFQRCISIYWCIFFLGHKPMYPGEVLFFWPRASYVSFVYLRLSYSCHSLIIVS